LRFNLVGHCYALLSLGRGFPPCFHFVLENVAGQGFGTVLFVFETLGGFLYFGYSLRVLSLPVSQFRGLRSEPSEHTGDQGRDGCGIFSALLGSLGNDFVLLPKDFVTLRNVLEFLELLCLGFDFLDKFPGTLDFFFGLGNLLFVVLLETLLPHVHLASLQLLDPFDL